MSSYELTILMPVLNEAETLATCIQKAKQFLENEHINGEILIADNGSTDGSQAIAKSLGARVVSVSTRGYGAALKGGVLAAQGKYVIMGDADDSYDFLSLKPFMTKLREGYDLVMGNRFKGGIMKGAMPFLNRYLGNPVLSFVGKVFYKSRVGDFHCGLRGFSRESILKLNLLGNGMEYASEMVIKATLSQFQIIEVPTRLYQDGRSRRPHLRPWRDGWRHLRLLLRYSPQWLFYYPGLILMAAGLISMGLLCVGPIVLGRVVFDIHTLLFSSMFMIVGLQAICFAGFMYFKQRKSFKLEHGLMASLFFLVLGGAGSIYGFYDWHHHAFGPLMPTQMMRILIPSVTFIIMGMQLMFSSFFMSMVIPIEDDRLITSELKNSL